jgi:hypothetical protein
MKDEIKALTEEVHFLTLSNKRVGKAMTDELAALVVGQAHASVASLHICCLSPHWLHAAVFLAHCHHSY